MVKGMWGEGFWMWFWEVKLFEASIRNRMCLGKVLGSEWVGIMFWEVNVLG